MAISLGIYPIFRQTHVNDCQWVQWWSMRFCTPARVTASQQAPGTCFTGPSKGPIRHVGTQEWTIGVAAVENQCGGTGSDIVAGHAFKVGLFDTGFGAAAMRSWAELSCTFISSIIFHHLPSSSITLSASLVPLRNRHFLRKLVTCADFLRPCPAPGLPKKVANKVSK